MDSDAGVHAPTAGGCAAAVLTAAFGLLVASSSAPFDVVRCSLVVAGCLSAISFLAVDVDPRVLHEGLAGGLLLVAYQACLSIAFTGGATAAQALVNCNVAIIAMCTRRFEPDVACACAGLAGCALYIARQQKT